jgi:hypothetical protein
MTSKTKKKRRKAKILPIQLLGGGAIRKARLPKGRKLLLFSAYRWRGGEMVEIKAIPQDPMSAGHTIWKIIDALATVYSAGVGFPYEEAVGVILASMISHAETELEELKGEEPSVPIEASERTH